MKLNGASSRRGAGLLLISRKWAIGSQLTQVETGDVIEIVEAKKVRLGDEVVSLTRAQQIVSGAPYAIQLGRYCKCVDGRTVSEHYETTYPHDDDADV